MINNFRYYRLKRHMTQDQLSLKTGISQNTISDYENYKYEPKLLHAFLISDALMVCISSLFRYDYESDNIRGIYE